MTAHANGFLIHADSTPLRVDEGGAVRVGASRISLDLVVELYQNGMTPEEMVQSYDTLVLEDVYGAIAYYLRHWEEVQAYLKRRREEADALQEQIETKWPAVSREELLSRRGARNKSRAPTG